MREKVIEVKLRDAVKRAGGMCLKLETPGYTGIPDRLLLFPGGRVAFAETKAPGKKERARQVFVQERLRALGFTVYSTVDSEAKVRQIVDGYTKERGKRRGE